MTGENEKDAILHLKNDLAVNIVHQQDIHDELIIMDEKIKNIDKDLYSVSMIEFMRLLELRTDLQIVSSGLVHSLKITRIAYEEISKRCKK